MIAGGLLKEIASADGARESLVRLPLGRGSGSSLLHHLINLFERKSLGLGNKEITVDERSRAKTAPNEENGRFEVSTVLSDHVGSNDSNDRVPQPISVGLLVFMIYLSRGGVVMILGMW